MASEKGILKNIADVSLETPESKRAETNLLRFFEAVSGKERFLPYLKETAKLFAVSQFLANFCISNPEELFYALREMREPLTKKLLFKKADADLVFHEVIDVAGIMKGIRLFKKRYLLRITLRNIMSETDILSSMDELTYLAEVVIHFTLQCSLKINSQKFGLDYSKKSE